MSENTTTQSVPLADLTIDQLLQISQGLGREIDKLREQRAYLKAKIEERLAKGEQVGKSPADGVAPGAVIDVATGG